MSNLVLDASAVLAVLQQELGGSNVVELMEAANGSVAISSVNFCEVVGKLVRNGVPHEEVRPALQMFRQYVVEFSAIHAERAGELCREMRSYGLSLGDRACLALAEKSDATVLTTDRIWKELAIGVRVLIIRD